MLNIGKIKVVPGAQMPVELCREPDPVVYGYKDFRLAAPLVFCGEVENQGDLLKVQGRVTAQLLLVCDRCGQGFVLPRAADIEEYYSPRQPDIETLGEQEIHFFSGDTIDIFPELLAQLYLLLPMKILCHPNCQGLCQNCGRLLTESACTCQEDSIDPRWEKLQELSLKGNSE